MSQPTPRGRNNQLNCGHRRRLNFIRGHAVRRLRMEPLETRLLLSAGTDGDGVRATYDSDTQLLTILGTELSDAAAVWADAQGAVSIESPPGVPIQICDPQGEPAKPTLDEVGSLLVSLYGGDDWLAVGYHTAGTQAARRTGVEPAPFRLADIAVYLGEGDDTLLWNTAAASPTWFVDAGNGDDDVTCELYVRAGDSTAGEPADDVRYGLSIDAGEGDDRVEVNGKDELGSAGSLGFSVSIDLGKGDDTTVADFSDATLVAASQCNCHVTVNGGEGNDTMTVLTPLPNNIDPPPREVPLKVHFFSGPGETDAIEVVTTDADEKVTIVGSIQDDVAGGRQFLIDVSVPDTETAAAELMIYTPTRVAADTGGGDDVVEIHAFENEFPAGSLFDIHYDVDLGQGDNLLTLDGKGNDVAVKVRAGDGADKAIVRVKPVPASPAGMSPGRLTAEIDLGGGDDVVRVRTLDDDSQVDSFFDIHYDIDLGQGDNLAALDGKGNDVAVKVRAGDGADKAIVRIKPVPASPAGMSPGRLTAEINMGGGDDVVRCSVLASPPQLDLQSPTNTDAQNVESSVLVVAGGGDDRVALQLAGVLDGAMHVGLLGQRGQDRLSVDASQLDIGRNGTLSVGIHGGRDADRIAFFNWAAGDDAMPPRIEGRLRLSLSGGKGNDTVAALLASSAFRTGDISVKVTGGLGDDLLTLLAEDVEGRLLIDGGRGYDEYAASRNVRVRNCEGEIAGPI